MSDELRSICDIHGIFLRREALALGYDDRALARAVHLKILHRLRHGAYVFWDHWASLDEVGRHRLLAMAVRRGANTGIVLSHTTAAVMLNAPIWDLPLDEVHATRLDGRAGRREAGVAQHGGLITPDEVVQVDRVAVTSATRTALDMTMIADIEHCLPIIDFLLHVEAACHQELKKAASRRAVWPSTLTTDLAVRLADGRRESVGESRSGYMFWRGGLPAPEPQFKVHDSSGRLVARVDFAWPELGVFLEFDGKEKYLRYRREGEEVVDVVRREKKREELICRLTGWRCIRIVWADLYHPRETVAYIRSVLEGGPVYR
jgi:Transcriptional regulator, AbiEi antitoxin